MTLCHIKSSSLSVYIRFYVSLYFISL
jgi:hypothetical protein